MATVEHDDHQLQAALDRLLRQSADLTPFMLETCEYLEPSPRQIHRRGDASRRVFHDHGDGLFGAQAALTTGTPADDAIELARISRMRRTASTPSVTSPLMMRAVSWFLIDHQRSTNNPAEAVLRSMIRSLYRPLLASHLNHL